MFEGDSPIDLHIGSVLEGAQVCAWRKHYWQEALVRAFLMEEPLKIFLVGGKGVLDSKHAAVFSTKSFTML